MHRDCDTLLDGRPSVDSTSFSRHRSIARYRPTIVLIEAGHCSVHSMPRSQIFAQNGDFCLPHLDSTPPLEGFQSEYCHAIWYGKTRMAWLPDGEKSLKICLFILIECTNVTDRHTDTMWWHRLHLHSIARQKLRLPKWDFWQAWWLLLHVCLINSTRIPQASL